MACPCSTPSASRASSSSSTSDDGQITATLPCPTASTSALTCSATDSANRCGSARTSVGASPLVRTAWGGDRSGATAASTRFANVIIGPGIR